MMPAQGKKRARGGGERVSKAPKMRKSCDACACAKRKCDGESRCSLCTKKGIPCVYSERQKSGPKGTHITEPAKQATAVAAPAVGAGGCTDKGGNTAPRRPSAASAPATGGSKPKKKVGGAAAPAAVAAAAAGVAGTRTIGWDQLQHKRLPSPSPQAPKSKTPRPGPHVAPITAASSRPSPASSLSAGSSPNNDEPTTSPASAAALPRQQPRAVAKKEPRPHHQRKNHAGRKGKDPAAAPAVVSPVGYPSAAGENGGVARMPVAPPLPPRRSLSSSKAAGAAAVPSVGSRERFASLPRNKVLPSAVPASVSSVDGAASSLSWDDVPDVFVSSPGEDVLWSCDELSDDGTGGGGSGGGTEGDEKQSPVGVFFSGLARGEKTWTVERAVSPTVEMMLLDDTTSHLAGEFGNHQQLRRQSSPALQERTASPSVVSARRQAALLEGNSKHQQPIDSDEPMFVGVLPAVRRRSSASSTSTGTDIGRRQNSFRNIPSTADCGNVTSSPISMWTQDAVEAGASTLLAVLADTDICGAAIGRGSDDVADNGGGHGGLQKQQQQQHFHHNHQHHQRPPAHSRSTTATTIGNHNARLSMRWLPQNIPASGHLAQQFGMGSGSSPPAPTPSATSAFADVGSRPWHHQAPTPAATTQQRHDSHYQHRAQPQGGPVSLDGRSLAEGMSATSKGSWAARGEWRGSKTYHTASL